MQKEMNKETEVGNDNLFIHNRCHGTYKVLPFKSINSVFSTPWFAVMRQVCRQILGRPSVGVSVSVQVSDILDPARIVSAVDVIPPR